MTAVWPFGRHRPPETGHPHSGTPGEPAVHRAEWRGLPPIQPAVTPVAGTFGTTSFETGLASRRSPALVGQMGHFVTPDAEGGTFEVAARPAGRRTFAQPPGAVIPAADAGAARELTPLPLPAAPPERPSLMTAALPVVVQRQPSSVPAPESRTPTGDSPVAQLHPDPSPVVAEHPAPSLPVVPIVAATRPRPGLGAALPPGASHPPTVQRTSAAPRAATPHVLREAGPSPVPPTPEATDRPGRPAPPATSGASGTSSPSAPMGDAPTAAFPGAGDAETEVVPLAGLRRLPTTSPGADDHAPVAPALVAAALTAPESTAPADDRPAEGDRADAGANPRGPAAGPVGDRTRPSPSPPGTGCRRGNDHSGNREGRRRSRASRCRPAPVLVRWLHRTG